MRRQIFQYTWEKQRDGCRYISAQDILQAICDSDQYPFPPMRCPKTLEERFVYEVMFETLDAVFAAIETAPQYVWQGGRLTRETDEEGNARWQEVAERRERM